MELDKESRILMLGNNRDYYIIEPTRKIIEKCVQSDIFVSSHPDFWDKVLECMRLKNSRLFACDFTNYERETIEVVELKNASAIDYALEFFRRAEAHREAHNADYVLVHGLRAKNIGDSMRTSRFYGETELLV